MLLRFFIFVLVAPFSDELPLSEFFPFGYQANDTLMIPNDDASVGPLPLPLNFPYFDNNHRQIWIANNGLFSFLSAIAQYVPNAFPLRNDSRLIAGFWSDIDTRAQLNNLGNQVFYQLYHRTSSSNTSGAVFDKARQYVRTFFSELQGLFEPKLILVGTWYRVGAFSQQTSWLNTFQIVLCTDGDYSFTFLLYDTLQWASPNRTSPPYAQAGFNAGDGVTYTVLPYSRTENIVQLVNESNVNTPGLFAFRVDTAIDAGGCDSNSSTFSFRSRIGSQLGFTALHIQGPCFTNETKVKCRFGSSSAVVSGFVLSHLKAVCLTPFRAIHERVPVDVSLDDGQTYAPVGHFSYNPLQFGSDDVALETEKDDNLLDVNRYINLTWHFPTRINNTFPNGTRIDIELWEVSLNARSELQTGSMYLLGRGLSFRESARVQLTQTHFSVSTCFIRVVARFGSQIYAGLNTGLLIKRSDRSRASDLCLRWVRQQPNPSTWNQDGLLLCPMTRGQAVAASRCCYERDPHCYRDSPDRYNCWLHRARPGSNESAAVECYRSIQSNRHGAGAECCYDNNGMIITHGRGAGTDDRYRPLALPIRHFFEDTLPYVHCCIISTNVEHCQRYMEARPPRRGSNTMNGNSLVWGDPHFATLDDASYIFNGYGEYTYLAIPNDSSISNMSIDGDSSYVFHSQIRTGPLSNSNVTVIKGFAAQSAGIDSEPVSFTVSQREQLLLRRGNDTLDFEDDVERLFFPELTISRLDGANHSLFSLSWSIGVNIRISLVRLSSPRESLLLNVAVSVSSLFRGKAVGLLGNFDGVSENDLRNRNGTIINQNASLEEIHRQFGSTWAIDPASSLFYYQAGQTAQFFHEKNRQFVPSFIDPVNSSAANQSIQRTCGIDSSRSLSSWTLAERSCYYDFFHSNDTNLAQSSLSVANELLAIKVHQRSVPLFDPNLPLVMTPKLGEQIRWNMTASSEYVSNSIRVSVLHLPDEC